MKKKMTPTRKTPSRKTPSKVVAGPKLSDAQALVDEMVQRAVFGGDVVSQALRQMLEAHDLFPDEATVARLQADREKASTTA